MKMQVPWNDQQEQQGQESGVTQSLEGYRGKSWRSDPILGGAVNVMFGSMILKEEAVILKLPWRHQDFEMLKLWNVYSGKLL